MKSIRQVSLIVSIFVFIFVLTPFIAHAATISLGTSGIIELMGEVTLDAASIGVTTVGDVNNDGFDDFLVASKTNDATGSNAGAAYLVYGRSSDLTAGSLGGSSNTIVKFTGEAVDDYAGTNVGSAGDVNNDGYSDLLIGAYHPATGNGAAYLIYGQSATFASTVSLGSAGIVKYTGEALGDAAGARVSGVGDVNNDGFDDFIITANSNDDSALNAGATYLIYGQSAALTSATLGAIEFTGEAAGDNAGGNLTTAGDLNNDGFDDFLIGAILNDDAGADAGSAYLFFGGSTLFTSASLSTADVEFTGEAAGDKVGTGVGMAGDVNNDNYDDILIGARLNDDNGTDAGAAYLIYSKPSTITITNNTNPTNTVECSTGTFTDPGATVTDQYTGSTSAASTTGVVVNTPPGNTSVVYTSAANNTLHIPTANTTRTVTVSDTVIPTITITGSSSITHEAGTTYTDAGATAIDACDSTVPVSATTINVNALGTQTITYSASDDSNNSATQKTRTVNVVDTTAPVITLIGESSVSIGLGETYVDDGASAIDSFTGDVTSSLVTLNEVDAAVAGVYIITYDVSDSSGNAATTISRTVTVIDHGSIVSIFKVRCHVNLVYEDAYTESIDPFSTRNRFIFSLTTDQRGVVFTNGKRVRIFNHGDLVAEQEINTKSYRREFLTLKVKKLYSSKSYDDVMVMLARKNTGKVSHIRLTSEKNLSLFSYQLVKIVERQPGEIIMNADDHQFTTEFGKGVKKTTSVWRVTSPGALEEV